MRYPCFCNSNYCTVMRMCNVIAFAGGVLAGGVIALMFAPKKGAELRKDIKGKLFEMKKEIDERMACCKDGRCGVEEKVEMTIEE